MLNVAGNEAIQKIGQITTNKIKKNLHQNQSQEDKTAPTITVNATYKKEKNKVEVNQLKMKNHKLNK